MPSVFKIPGSDKYAYECEEARHTEDAWKINIWRVRGEHGVVASFLLSSEEEPKPNVVQLMAEMWLAGKTRGERIGKKSKLKEIREVLEI